MIKVIKILKQRGTLVNKISEKLKINSGLERLIIFSFLFILFTHVAACLFLVLASFENGFYINWMEYSGRGFENYSGID
jgi:hypothetical protein